VVQDIKGNWRVVLKEKGLIREKWDLRAICTWRRNNDFERRAQRGGGTFARPGALGGRGVNTLKNRGARRREKIALSRPKLHGGGESDS